MRASIFNYCDSTFSKCASANIDIVDELYSHYISENIETINETMLTDIRCNIIKWYYTNKNIIFLS